MADPLSVTASVVGITSFALTTVKGVVGTIESIRDAPRAIQATLRELQDVKAVLASLDSELKSDSLSVDVSRRLESNTQLKSAIQSCSSECERLHKALISWTKHSVEGKRSKRDSLRFGLLGERKFQPFRDSLEKAKGTLGLALQTETYLDFVAHRTTSSNSQTVWTVPRPSNSKFIGRIDVLERLAVALDPGKNTSQSEQRCFVISGLGGIGKSEICIRFAESFRENFWGVFWLDVESHASITQTCGSIAGQCNAAEDNIAGVKAWLAQQKEDWLLVIDNADDSKTDYSQFFPPCDHGNIILTTRDSDLGDIHQSAGHVCLDSLGTNDARHLLLISAGIPKIRHEEQTPAADKILQALNRHTLAITQAGALIRSMKAQSLEVYLSLFEKQRKMTLEFPLVQNRPRYGNIFTTFEVSAVQLDESIEQEDKDALQLLQVLPFMNPAGIKEQIFEEALITATSLLERVDDKEEEEEEYHNGYDEESDKETYEDDYEQSEEGDNDGIIEDVPIWQLSNSHANYLPSWLWRDRTNSDAPYFSRRRRACLRLASLSLITLHDTGDFLQFSLHPLIHAWARERLSEGEKQHACRTTACILALATRGERAHAEGYRLVIPHIHACIKPPFETCFRNDENADTIEIVFQLAYAIHYTSSGPVETSKRLFAMIRQRLETLSETRENDVLYIMGIEADLMVWTGNGQSAVQVLEPVVEVVRSKYRETSLFRLSIESRFSQALVSNGSYKQALKLLEHVVQVLRRTLPEEDPYLKNSESLLAVTLLRLEPEDKGAIEMLERVVNSQKNLAETNVNRQRSECLFANALMTQGENERALEILERVVDIQKQTMSETNRLRIENEEALARSLIFKGDNAQAMSTQEG